MITFFGNPSQKVFAVQTVQAIATADVSKLNWLFGDVEVVKDSTIEGSFVGPRATMITPWSTNAVEITQNMGVDGIIRIEEFQAIDTDSKDYDPMLQHKYNDVNQDIFTFEIKPEAVMDIEDIAAYTQQEGLALNTEEVDYLDGLAKKLGRKLTDSEVFGFSQVNSELWANIQNSPFLIALFTAILTLPQATHYVLDGFIWKFGQTNPNLKKIIANE